MLESSQFIKVVVENRRVNVSGREHETGHVILVGAEALVAEINYEFTRAEASFTAYPSVEFIERDVLKVSDPNARYEVDVLGERIKEVRQEEAYVLKGDLVSIKFEVDDETGSVIVKIPKLKKLKVKSLHIKSQRKTTLNVMTFPFTIGVLSVYNATCIIRQLEDQLFIEAQ